MRVLRQEAHLLRCSAISVGTTMPAHYRRIYGANNGAGCTEYLRLACDAVVSGLRNHA
jgi:hypothetical protein